MKRQLKGRRPRIGVDLHVLEGKFQGSRTHCFELFSQVHGRLPQFDFQFFVDTTRWDGQLARFFTAPNAEVVSMPHANSFVRLAVGLPRLVKQHAIDLMHTQYVCPLRGGTPNAVTIHDILFEDYPQYFQRFLRFRSKILFRRSAKLAQLVFTVSDYSKRQLISTYDVPPAKVITIRNGANFERFFPGNQSGGRSSNEGANLDVDLGEDKVKELGLEPGNYLLTVGRLEPRKNHLGMLQAYAALPSPRPRLVIVGQRDFGYEQIFGLCDSLHLANEVQFLETVDDDLLAALYRYCGLFLYPTFAEGFGMPVVEAMASGAPVITSNTTSLPEIAGDAALLIDPGSTEAITKALNYVLGDPALAREMRLKGLSHAKTFQWSSSVEIMAKAYEAFFSGDEYI